MDWGFRCNCNNCGEYGIESYVKNILKEDEDKRFRTACVATERRLKGKHEYVITNGEIDEKVSGWACISIERFLEEFPETVLEILNRALLNLGRMISHPGDIIECSKSNRFVFFSKNISQMLNVARQFEKLGYVELSSVTMGGSFVLAIQPEGWKEIQELTVISGLDSNQAFVAMCFDPSEKDVYDEGIKPALKACELKSIRIDLKEHNEDIVDEILMEIKRSRCVVADFTGGRQGVYFEAGFARGLGIPVIWLVHKDRLDDLHFDTRQYNHILYKNAEELRKKLENRIRATVL